MSKLDDLLQRFVDDGKYRFWVVVCVALALFLVFAAAHGAEDQKVRLGKAVFTDMAILCMDVKAAKALSDLTKDEELEILGRQLMQAGICAIAGGSMVVDSLEHIGKRYNVFKTHDSTLTFYWVTDTQPQYD